MCTYRQLHENCIQCQPKNSHQQAKHNSLFDLHQVWIQSRVGCSSASTFLYRNPSTHLQSSYHQQKATRALCLVLCHRGSSSLKILQRTLKCCPILGTSHRRDPSVQILTVMHSRVHALELGVVEVDKGISSACFFLVYSLNACLPMKSPLHVSPCKVVPFLMAAPTFSCHPFHFLY